MQSGSQPTAERFDMTPLTLQDVLDVLAPGMAAPWAAGVVATDVCIDSRRATPGSLFVAFVGERVDGHNYVRHALAAGATLALVERPVPDVAIVDTTQRTWPVVPVSAVAVLVPSTLLALQALARARRAARPDLRVIGISGAVGKTTSKEVIAGVLERRYPLLKSQGNHNNEIGLPLTLLTLRPEHQRAVLEMGMYALGEVAALCAIAQPQVGVVTKVEPVHLDRLGAIERIAQAEGELPKALSPEGVAVLNADDPWVAAMATQTRAQVVTFGESSGAQIRLVSVEGRGLEGSVFDVQVKEHPLWLGHAGRERFRTQLLGRPAIMAALAAIAVGLVEGMTLAEIREGLALVSQGLRLVRREGRHGVTVLDDSYNSSPPAALAALDLLRGLNRRRIAVLGDMLELGAIEAEGHQQVGERAAVSCDLLVTVGQRAKGIAAAALAAGMPAQAVHALDNNAQAIERLAGLIKPEDIVLVKGSRSMTMEEIVHALGAATA